MIRTSSSEITEPTRAIAALAAAAGELAKRGKALEEYAAATLRTLKAVR